MDKIKGVIFMIRSTGLLNVLRVLIFTLQRDWLNRSQRRRAAERQRTPPISPGKLLESTSIPSGARFRFENANLQIEFLADDLACLSWEPGSTPPAYAIAKHDWAPVQVSLNQAFEGWRVTSPGMQILVDQNGALQYLDAHGRLLRDDAPPTRQLQTWTLQSRLQTSEHIYGLGEQSGPLNLRGVTRRLWNHDPGGAYGPGADPLYMPMPVYLALHQDGSYLIFFENSFPASAQFSSQESASPSSQISFEDGMLRYYLMCGTPASLLEYFTELTGRPELPPRWSLGYHQSRWGYQNAEQIRQVVAGFGEHDLPLDVIHLDIDYMRGYRVFSVDPARFPNLKELATELSQRQIRVVTIIDPGVKQDSLYPLYREGVEQDLFCKLPNGKILSGIVWPGWSAYPDFTNPKTRAWWGRQYSSLLSQGVSGFWHDMNEPTSFASHGDQDLPLAGRHDLDGQGGDHLQAHNLYALQMNRAAHEALRQQRPEQRPWLVSRSGWVSQQRYAWNWTADTTSTWESLHMTIATMLGLGLSGIPYTGPDIGGFSGDPAAELYLRWFQMATFLPFFRTHSAIGVAPREPWVFGEPTTSIVRRFLHLRQRLMPYLYTLAWQANQKGYPLLRPLFWADPQDTNLWSIDDAFMLGDALLVAPALAPELEERSLRLPAGEWFNLWNDQHYSGPATVALPLTLEEIPVLVAAGSVLPLARQDCLELHLYPAAANSHKASPQAMYSDAGDGYGEGRVDQFTLASQPDQLTLEWKSEGKYPFPYATVEIHLHGLQAKQAWVDRKTAPIQENRILSGIFSQARIEV
jgi:alpha-glucosidase